MEVCEYMELLQRETFNIVIEFIGIFAPIARSENGEDKGADVEP